MAFGEFGRIIRTDESFQKAVDSEMQNFSFAAIHLLWMTYKDLFNATSVALQL